MKISCPHCQQNYDAESDLLEQQVTCQSCNNDFTIPAPQPANLINCPDCGKEVSKRAESCPNCGAPVKNEYPRASAAVPSVAVKADARNNTLRLAIILFIIIMLAVFTGVFGYNKYRQYELAKKVEETRYWRCWENILTHKLDYAAYAYSKANGDKNVELPPLVKSCSSGYSLDYFLKTDFKKFKNDLGDVPVIVCRYHNIVLYADGHASGFTKRNLSYDEFFANIPEAIKQELKKQK